MTKFQGSGFSFQSLNQNIKVGVFPSNFWFQKFKVVVFPLNFWIQFFKVVVFPSYFWNTTIIWQIVRVILNFAQKGYYLENKVGVVDFTKFQNPRALKHYQSLGVCKIYYSHFIFKVMYHWQIFNSNFLFYKVHGCIVWTVCGSLRSLFCQDQSSLSTSTRQWWRKRHNAGLKKIVY